jgi:hypothetical protein
VTEAEPTPAAPATPSAAPTPAPAPTATPAPTPAPVPDGRLLVTAMPWADVYVDEQYQGQTPLQSFALSPGAHAIRLQHPDYQPYRRRVTIEPGQLSRLHVDLSIDAVRRLR